MIHRELLNGTQLDVKTLCELSGVSRSGYYRWANSMDNRARREERDLADFKLIKEAYDYRGYNKGYRSIAMRLQRTNHPMNHKKIRRLMVKYGLHCPIRQPNPYKRMARAIKTNAISPNHVDRKFRCYGARSVLLTDITYIRLGDGFVYLSVIKDAYTMQILSYVLNDSLEVDFVLETITKLMANHKCSLNTETWVHSDQGCHYTSVAFRQLLTDFQLRQSMSRRGNCWDNAPQESFFSMMKQELKPYIKEWKTFDDIKSRIDDWMDYYNNDRYQTILKKMSPNEFNKYINQGEIPSGLCI